MMCRYTPFWIDILPTIFNRLAALVLLSTMPYLPAYAAVKPWATLTPMQQEALAPIGQQWNTLPETQQKRLLATTKRYPQLSQEQKNLFLSRLTDWSKLTPEQRNQAREKYKNFRKLPPEKREEIKQKAHQKELNRNLGIAASGVAPATPK